MEEMTNIKALKELERVLSHDMLMSTFEYRNYKFRYIEVRGSAKIIVDGYAEKDVKPMKREAFETWCIIWSVEH